MSKKTTKTIKEFKEDFEKLGNTDRVFFGNLQYAIELLNENLISNSEKPETDRRKIAEDYFENSEIIDIINYVLASAEAYTENRNHLHTLLCRQEWELDNKNKSKKKGE